MKEIEDLSLTEEYEEDCFSDYVLGETVSSFNFDSDNLDSDNLNNATLKSQPMIEKIIDTRLLKTQGNEKTPEIDGEAFDVQRCYKLRNSTARMLNEIKAIHPDVNVYMNTIVDAAIRHYHECVFKDFINTNKSSNNQT